MPKIENLQNLQKENEVSGPIDSIIKFAFGIDTNKGMEAYKKENINLFSHARKSIMIVSGVLNHEFYNDEGIIDSLNDAIENKVKVEIITGPEENIDKKSMEILDLYKQGKITILSLPSTPKLHFFVVDGKHVGLENYHSDHEGGNETTILQRTIALGDKQTSKFIKLKDKTELLQLDKIG